MRGWVSASFAASSRQGEGDEARSLRSLAVRAGRRASRRRTGQPALADPAGLSGVRRVLLPEQPRRRSVHRREGADRQFDRRGRGEGARPAGLRGNPAAGAAGRSQFADRPAGARHRATVDRQSARGGGRHRGGERHPAQRQLEILRLGCQRHPVRPGQCLLPARRQDGRLHRPDPGGAERRCRGRRHGARDRPRPAAPWRAAHVAAEAHPDRSDGRRHERHGSATTADGDGRDGLRLPAALRTRTRDAGR